MGLPRQGRSIISEIAVSFFRALVDLMNILINAGILKGYVLRAVRNEQRNHSSRRRIALLLVLVIGALIGIYLAPKSGRVLKKPPFGLDPKAAPWPQMEFQSVVTLPTDGLRIS